MIETIRAEMAQAGRWFADRYGFVYPYELEEVVQHTWNEYKSSITSR